MSNQDRSCAESLVAAYREGLRLARVSLLSGETGICIATERDGSGAEAAGKTVLARWWCRRASEAEWVAAAARARLRRHKAMDRDVALASAAQRATASDAASLAGESIASAAKQLNIALFSDEDISHQAKAVVARIDREIESLQRSGGLRSINKSYREYRIKVSGHGARILRYQDWMRKYREHLVRELAATLRYF
jgi:hypothetical protein